MTREYEDLLRASTLTLLLWLGAGSLHAQTFSRYDLLVPKSAVANGVTVVDGRDVPLPSERSYVIGIEGGIRNPIEFRNWVGTAEQPVVIVNRHGTGRVSITDEVADDPGATPRTGIFINHCQHLQLRGDNDPSVPYGIEIARAGGRASGTGQRGVEVTGRSSDVEVMFLEIHDIAFAGIMVKQDPACGPANAWTWHPTLVYRNISLHDNYIHDVGGEGLYVGFTFWGDDRCAADPDGGYSHNIEGLRIYSNLIERCAWDGLQVGAATQEVEIFDNVIVDSGVGGCGTASGDTGAGVQIGSGTTGLLYNNLIINSRNNGISMFGLGHNVVFNNLVYGGKLGIFLDNRPKPIPAGQPADRQTQPGSPYYVINNTFIAQSSHAMWTMSDITDNQFNNNLAVLRGEPAAEHRFIRYEMGATGTEAGNVFQRDVTGLEFADPDHYDFRILNASNAVDRGTALAQVRADFVGTPRPQGKACDAGYSESGTLSVYLVARPPSWRGRDGTITAAAINGALPYTYAWSTGATTATISDLAPGLYRVAVSDATGRVVNKATYLFAGASMGAPVSRSLPPRR